MKYSLTFSSLDLNANFNFSNFSESVERMKTESEIIYELIYPFYYQFMHRLGIFHEKRYNSATIPRVVSAVFQK